MYYIAFGMFWQHAKYSYGAWESFAQNSENFQKSPKIEKGANPAFWLNFVGLVPLATILGAATEELAAGLKNDMLAALLNATFGNAVEARPRALF